MPSVKVLFEDGAGIEHVNIEDPETLSSLGWYWNEVGKFLRGDPNDLAVAYSLVIDGRRVETRADVIEDWVATGGDIYFDEMYDDE
jgi:hypothetical protein